MTIKMNWLYIALALVILMGCVDNSQTDPAEEERTDGDIGSTPVFDPIVVAPTFPAITDAPIISAGEVVDQVVDKELVLGVVLNGEARAYPINMLTGPSREIINDTLGDRAIAATW